MMSMLYVIEILLVAVPFLSALFWRMYVGSVHFYSDEEGKTKCRFELCEEPEEISKRRFVIMIIRQ